MARRKRVLKRPEILPDPVYKSVMISKFINRLMWDGRKTVAERMFYKAMDVIKEKTGKEPLEVFNKAIENVQPDVEVRSRRVGGASYQVPVEVREERKKTLAIRWLVSLSRARKERGFHVRLASELMEAANEAGNAFKRKIDTHKMADANRAFAHLKW